MNQFRKAYTAAGVGLVLAIGAALNDGNLTTKEALAAVGAALLLGGGVYQVKNVD